MIKCGILWKKNFFKVKYIIILGFWYICFYFLVIFFCFVFKNYNIYVDSGFLENGIN